MTKRHNSTPLLENIHGENDKDEFRKIIFSLKYFMSKYSAPDKSALMTNVFASSCDGPDPYKYVTLRIAIIPWDKVDSYLKEKALEKNDNEIC